MWGADGYQGVAEMLAPDVRERTASMRPLPDWLPLDDLIAWHVAVWNGPAKRNESVFTEHVHKTVDQGFGKVKRLLLSMATPQTLAPRVVALWDDEYSTGYLEAGAIESRSVTLTLHEHPYVQHQLMRMVIAEVYRYVLSLTKAKGVTAVHTVRDATLVVVLRWT
ncbi:MAG TPA: hypothetical protein VHU80_19515 [Polyangiaceae bacterium]|jgi:hypothetical protein|nr:hypothetical protein [Polyangiaceae bacterium]